MILIFAFSPSTNSSSKQKALKVKPSTLTNPGLSLSIFFITKTSLLIKVSPYSSNFKSCKCFLIKGLIKINEAKVTIIKEKIWLK